MVPIYGTTLVDHMVFVLGRDQEALDGAATFEVGVNAMSTTDLLDAFTKTLCVGYDNVTLVLTPLVIAWAPVMPWLITLSMVSCRLVESFLHLVQSPFRIFAFSESLPKMVHFLLEQLKPL